MRPQHFPRWLGAGLFAASIALAGDRMVLVYGGADADFANLREIALAALAGSPVSGEATVVQVEGSRALTAEHSTQPGTRAFFMADGGGFLMNGFNANGASVQFRVFGKETEAPAAKRAPATSPALPTYVSALGSVSLVSGLLRVEYTQAKAGRVQVDVIGLNGKVLNRSAWQGDPGRHSRSMSLNVPRRQVVFVRWTDGPRRQVQKILAQ